MESKFKLTVSELADLKKLGEKNDLLKKAYELIDIIQLSVVPDTLVALKKSHLELCNELIKNGVSLFNNENAKDFDNFTKFKASALDTVSAIKSLESSLTPEEVKEVNKKMKDSQQLFIPKVNGNQVEN